MENNLNFTHENEKHVYAPDSISVLSSFLTSKLWLSMSKHALYFYSHAYKEPKWHPKDFSPLIACSRNSYCWHHSSMGVFSKTSTSFLISTHSRRNGRLSMGLLLWFTITLWKETGKLFFLLDTKISVSPIFKGKKNPVCQSRIQ